MKLLQRVIRRSGELSFDQGADSAEQDDLRFKWVRALGLSANNIIDFGCWTGGALNSVAPNANRRTGLDLPGPWIDEARRRLPEVEFIATDSFENVPDGLEAQFDLALFLDTLEHIPRGTEPAVLRSINSVLSPKGMLVLSTPLAGWTAPLDPAWLLVGHRHYRGATVARILREAGFRDIKIYYSGNLFTAVAALQMYFKKHFLHRIHYSSAYSNSKLDTGLIPKWFPTAINVWAVAQK